MIVAIIIIVALVIYIAYDEYKKQQAHKSDKTQEEAEIKLETTNLPYRKKYLLTKNEWSFYKSLKLIADELGYTVLAKIRVADIVEPIPNNNQSEWQKYFNKINRKHIDFAFAKPENLQIILLIELDDNSHDTKQIERDKFIDELYKQTGYSFIRVRGTGELKEKITNVLNAIQK